LRATAHHHLERLRDLSDETVTLQLRVGQQRVCIDNAESRQPIRRVAHFGESTPLHVGVTGKVITAFLPSEEAEPVIANAVAAGQDPDRLQRLLESIRRRGYYVSIGDKGEGIAAVSAPVMASSSEVVAALTVSGPDHRWTIERMQQFAPTVMAAAREVSAALVVHG
jgi:IclR family transcriptional regulator, KDG regulon repressor